jgi:hypothetical protein
MSKKEMEAIACRNAAIDKMTQTDKRLYNLEKSLTTKKKKKKKKSSGSKITGLGKLGTLNVGTYKPFS